MSVTDANDLSGLGSRPEELPDAVEVAIAGHSRPLGGIEVTRVLPSLQRRNVGPFVFLDHMGPVNLPKGRGFDVPPHPHIGLSTVTYLLEGEIVHRDHLGSVQPITPGAINLMVAGRGIVHSERSSPETRARGASMHGLQLWLALPLHAEDGPPAFHHHPEKSLPSWRENGVDVRLLLGVAGERRSPATDPSEPLLMDLSLPAGASFTVPAGVADCAVYVADGSVSVGASAFGRHRLVVRAKGATLSITASVATRAFVLGGAPLDAKRYIDWNFVSSSPESIERAKESWRANRFPKIPGDDQEFVPLPEKKSGP